MKKRSLYLILLVSLMLSMTFLGLFLIFSIPRERDDTNMVDSRRYKSLGITSAKKPIHTHLFNEYTNGDLTLVDSTSQTDLLISDDKGSAWNSINTGEFSSGKITRTKKIRTSWYDVANSKIYFLDSDRDLTTSYIWSLNTSTYALTEEANHGDSNGYDIWIMDLFGGGTALYYMFVKPILETTEVYVQILGVRLDSTDLGDPTARTFDLSQVVVVGGQDAYFLWKWSDENVKLYYYNYNTHAISLAEDCGANTQLPSINQRGLSLSTDEDTIYFVLQDTGDSKYYLYNYVISTDTLTKGAEYNIALQLDRNNRGTVPNELEKGFGIANEIVYEIKPNRGGIIQLQDISAIADANITAITDNFLMLTNGKMFEWTNVSIRMDSLYYDGGIIPIPKLGSFLVSSIFKDDWNEGDSFKYYDDSGKLEIWAKITKRYVDLFNNYHYDFDFYSNEMYRPTYEKAYSNDETSTKQKDIIDNAFNFNYRSSSIVDTTLTYSYNYKRTTSYLFDLGRFLERQVPYIEPDGKVWTKAYDGLTATGKSWTLNDGNQNVQMIDIPDLALDRGGYFRGSLGVTRATVRYKDNVTSTKPTIPESGKTTTELLMGIIELKEFRDSKLEGSTEADQLATNLYDIFTSTIQYIGLRVEGEGFLQEGKTIEIENTGQIIIPQTNFLILKYRRWPLQDVTNMVVSDNIIFPFEFTSFGDTTRLQVHGASLQSFENQAALHQTITLNPGQVITSSDEDLTFTFGRVELTGGFGDATFKNRDATRRAVLQTASGRTTIGSDSGQVILFRIINTTKMTISTSLLTMTIEIAMGTNKITGCGDPTNDQDVATKKWVEDNFTPL